MPHSTAFPVGESRQPPRRVYLDNAATSWPKSAAVLQASFEFMEQCGAAAGRGSYASAQLAEQWIQRARVAVARLLNAASPHDVAFCGSGTHALNAILQGLLKPGQHVITTNIEHNSVLRPLAQMQRERSIRFDTVDLVAGETPLDSVRGLLTPETTMLLVGHASNVTGKLNELGAWGEFARQHQLTFVVDGSQTLGYVPVDLQESGIDAFAAAAHKGLRALPGTAIACVTKDLQADLHPIMFGGTGRASESMDALPEWPQSIEVGNVNTMGLVSIAVAAEELLHDTRDTALPSLWLPTFARLVRGLSDIPGVDIVGSHLAPLCEDASAYARFSGEGCPFLPVVSIRVPGWDVHDLASILDTSFHIETRAGWHCAALVHEALGTNASNGTLRFSTGRASTDDEIDYTLDALRQILAVA